MFALVALVGLLAFLLVVSIGVAYASLPSGRMCHQCGGPTDSVVPRRLARWLGRWLQWRWCSRCGWEGVGRNGPDVAPFEAPVDHDSGFRWQRPDGTSVPVFYWKPEGEPVSSSPDHPSGFRWGRTDVRPDALDRPPGFRFRPIERPRGPRFEWHDATPDRRRPSHLRDLFASREPPRFRWRK